MITGSSDRTIKLWDSDPKTKDVVQTIVGHGGTVVALCYSRHNDTLFSSSNDKTIRIWKYPSSYAGRRSTATFSCIPGTCVTRLSKTSPAKEWSIRCTPAALNSKTARRINSFFSSGIPKGRCTR